MQISLHLQEMTTLEKIRIMELIWEDLSRNPEAVPSPSWYEQILREREDNLLLGTESIADWVEAKQRIRESKS